MGESLAHVAPDGRTHSLEEHLREVARRAGVNGASFGAGDHAALAGLWHDLGKYASDFQAKLEAVASMASAAHVEAEDEIAAGRMVDHSTAGAFHAAKVSPSESLPIVFAIAGHHAGLANWSSQLAPRLKERGATRLAAAMQARPPSDIVDHPVPTLPEWARARGHADKEGCRATELFTRFVFSALCDADFLDTEAFFDPLRASHRGPRVTLAQLAERLTVSIDGMTREDSAVNRIRAEVRGACIRAADRPQGVFTLTVPTGGGKTLASMELALRHALRHDLRRVIVGIPFTSILEQSALVFRRAFGLVDDDTTVLEHHSAMDPLRETARSRLASENWDTPVVVTTNVQLLESLFARRTSSCRKLHNIARSVIILDEAQTMSRDLLAPTTDVLQSLVDHYGCTIVLCTATQPTLSRGVLQDCGFVKTEEVVEDPDGLAERLRRVEVDWSRAASPISWSALAEELAGESDALAIVHRRDDARELALAIDVFTGDASTIHLSALMCPAHRQAVLATIRSRKGRGEAVRVVSTQLVEAGVDLDFPVVYRALAGVDAMTQAAGRCNREGRLTRLGALRVFRAPTSPPKGILEQGLDVTTSMLAAGPLDLFAPGTHARYFSDLYGLHLHDTKEIQALRAELRFEDVARAYQMIQDEWSAPLTVPLDDRARTTIRDLERLGPSRDRLRAIARSTVNVRKNDLAGWLASGSVRSIADGLVNVLVDGGVYDPRFGLIPERVGTLSPTRSVV